MASYALTCERCGEPFEAKRRDRRTCSDACRVALNTRTRRANTEAAAEKPDVPVDVVASTLAELAAAGRQNSALGQSALLLAYRIDRSQADTPQAVAALVKQHNATLADALKGVGKASRVDELKARRDAKRAG